MTRLSVNINKIALLRNSRGSNRPDLLKAAADAELYGADGITIHPRPDQRHVKFSDVYELKNIVKTEFNIEGNPNEHFIKMVSEVHPHQVTLVPDDDWTLTSDSGWDMIKYNEYLKKIVAEFHKENIRISLFCNANTDMVKAAADTGTDRIELYTGPYAKNYFYNKEKAISDYILSAETAVEYGLGLNAGHDLDLNNLQYFKQNIPNLLEVSIGHALISDAIYLGFENTIRMYKKCLGVV